MIGLVAALLAGCGPGPTQEEEARAKGPYRLTARFTTSVIMPTGSSSSCAVMAELPSHPVTLGVPVRVPIMPRASRSMEVEVDHTALLDNACRIHVLEHGRPTESSAFSSFIRVHQSQGRMSRFLRPDRVFSGFQSGIRCERQNARATIRM